MHHSMLVTAFSQFGGFSVNPAELILKQLSEHYVGFDMEKIVLPVDYNFVVQRLPQLYLRLRPAIAVHLGVNEKNSHLCLERRAKNLTSQEQPDINGVIKHDGPIDDSAPTEFITDLDLEKLKTKLIDLDLKADSNADLKYEISEDAGSYLCNFAYFTALQTIKQHQLQTQCLFVHVPVPNDINVQTESVEEKKIVSIYSLAELTVGVSNILALLSGEYR